MKILYVLDKPNLYGSERHVQKLIESFKGSNEIYLLTFQEGPLLDLITVNHQLLRLSWLNLFQWTKWRKIRSILSENQIDIIHAHQPKAMFVMSILGRLTGVKTIITVHSLPISNSQAQTGFLRAFFVLCGHHIVKSLSELLANQIIYLSSFSSKTSLFPSKVHVIPNWVNSDTPAPAKDYDKLGQKIKFVTVGTVSFNKGFDRLIKALGYLNLTDWELHVIGGVEPTFQVQLSNLMEEFPAKNQVIFHGFQADVSAYLEASDVFILLTRAETFGLVYIEAMRYGLPIITWDIPIVNELIPEGNLIIKSVAQFANENMLQFLSKENRSSLDRINRRFVLNKFQASKIIPIYQSLYSHIQS